MAREPPYNVNSVVVIMLTVIAMVLIFLYIGDRVVNPPSEVAACKAFYGNSSAHVLMGCTVKENCTTTKNNGYVVINCDTKFMPQPTKITE